MSRILLLEDNAITLKIIKTFLEAEGFNISTYSNGKEGIESLKNESFDLVITDIYMPVQNGLDTIRIIRKQNSKIKILAMSSGIESGNADYLREAMELGATATLTKPINRKKLIELVKAMINNTESEYPGIVTPPDKTKKNRILYIDEQKTILKSIQSHFNNVTQLKKYTLVTSNTTGNISSLISNMEPSLLFIQYELLSNLDKDLVTLIKKSGLPIISTVNELPEQINVPKSLKVANWATRILDPVELGKLIKNNL